MREREVPNFAFSFFDQFLAWIIGFKIDDVYINGLNKRFISVYRLFDISIKRYWIKR
jgi:hypothetical protein